MDKNAIMYYPPWKELVDKYKDKPYGSLITYEEMSEAIKVSEIRDETWTLSKFKTELLHQFDRALESKRNEGYRIVNPNEHARLTSKHIRKAERSVRRGVDIALHIDYDSLNDTEKAQITLVANRAQSVHAALVGESKSIRSITINYQLPSIPRILPTQ